ncbi:DUF6518 family protein [Winogradskya humida]|uniref:Uncharacterized protein n=1 Tax=Winogradskya humida TaxID=113566 RepID=A0ABQ4A8E3_9ACTN|nr:DUF6518 family protein [Actinoplanes humidus]GIE26903.1 hypothetical protein Ahu01nite_100050 [Actinoplanes humidus]
MRSPRPPVRRTLTMLGAALAFGMLAALIKGHHHGVRDTIGNLSTPWLLVALLSGLHTPSLRRGAVLGLAATVTALLGFYLVVAVITDEQLVGLRDHLAHVLSANRRWLFSGLLSGPLLGAFGAWLRGRFADPTKAAAVVTGLLLIAEPLVIVGAPVVPGSQQIITWTLTPVPYLIEAALGVLVLTLALRRPPIGG